MMMPRVFQCPSCNWLISRGLPVSQCMLCAAERQRRAAEQQRNQRRERRQGVVFGPFTKMIIRVCVKLGIKRLFGCTRGN